MGKVLVRITAAIIVVTLAYYGTSLGTPLRIGVGICIAILSGILMVTARRQLGDAFAVLPEARGLVTTGLYSRIQHPMYLFLDLALAAVIVATGIPTLLIVWAVLVVVQFIQGSREERLLAAAYNDAYRTYLEQLWI